MEGLPRFIWYGAGGEGREAGKRKTVLSRSMPQGEEPAPLVPGKWHSGSFEAGPGKFFCLLFIPCNGAGAWWWGGRNDVEFLLNEFHAKFLVVPKMKFHCPGWAFCRRELRCSWKGEGNAAPVFHALGLFFVRKGNSFSGNGRYCRSWKEYPGCEIFWFFFI